MPARSIAAAKAESDGEVQGGGEVHPEGWVVHAILGGDPCQPYVSSNARRLSNNPIPVV